MPEYGSCNLSSVNLSQFVLNPFSDNAKVDIASLTEAVKEVVVFMDGVLEESIEKNLFPLKEQREVVRKWRPIGVGVLGFHDMLIKLGVRYGSQESIDIIHELGREIVWAAMEQSIELAKKYGAYEKFDYNSILQSDYYQAHYHPRIDSELQKYGMRNSHLLSIAPTGSISTLLDASSATEPIFEKSYVRKTESLHLSDTYYKVFTTVVKEYMEFNNITDEKELPDFIVTSSEIPISERIAVQSAWQHYIDTAISSTVNLPEEATIDDVKEIYIQAWKSGLKGITVFRDNCKRIGILTKEVKETQPQIEECST